MRSRDIKRRLGIARTRNRYSGGVGSNRNNGGVTGLVSSVVPRLPRFRLPRIAMPRFGNGRRGRFLPQAIRAPGVIRIRNLKEYIFRLCVFAAIILVAFGSWRLTRPGIRVRVDADTVAAFRVPHRAIRMLRDYAEREGINFAELFAIFNAENDFFPEKSAVYDLSVLERLYVSDFQRLLRRYNTRSLEPYVTMFNNLFTEIETFPIPSGWYEHDASVMFGNSWGVEHNFQGNPMHMGTAIVDRENIRGRVPVVSMTRGRVQSVGWDNNLGYFVGITTENGTFFLYAHLDSLATGLATGQNITAGQPLGQMGNSGGGRGGRSFPVHLHLAIAPDVSFTRGQFWINPYPLLRYIENPTRL